MPSKRKELINPVRVFFAIIIVVIIWFAPIAFPLRGKEAVEIKETSPLVHVFASSADAFLLTALYAHPGKWAYGRRAA